MVTIDAKTLKSFCSEIESSWWIENPTFRQKYNSYLSAALLKGYEMGDFSWITRILKATPDKKLRERVRTRIVKALPLSYREKTESLVKDHKRWPNYTAQNFQDFVGVGLNDFIEEKDGKVLFEKVKLEPAEFVDFVLDTIIFNRNHFSTNDLEKISDTLSLVKDRLEKQMVKKA